jgi:hypothetical protein
MYMVVSQGFYTVTILNHYHVKQTHDSAQFVHWPGFAFCGASVGVIRLCSLSSTYQLTRMCELSYIDRLIRYCRLCGAHQLIKMCKLSGPSQLIRMGNFLVNTVSANQVVLLVCLTPFSQSV